MVTADDTGGVHDLRPEQLFPWIRLCRGVGMAIDAKKLILAAVGLLVFVLGREGIDRFVFVAPASGRPTRLMEQVRLAPPPGLVTPGRGGVVEMFHDSALRMTEPVRLLVGPYLRVFALNQGWQEMLSALVAAVWATMVWGIFGGAIARIAIVQAARAERVGIGEALRFAAKKWLPLVGTPLCPLLGVAFFTALCAGFGLLYRLPGDMGPTIAGAFAVFPLLAALVMTIILFSLAASWPLMHATVAAEGEDGFDALSRSFAYVNQRSGRYAVYWLIAWGLGSVGLLFVDLFARATVHMTHWSLSFGAPDRVLVTMFRGSGVSIPPLGEQLHGLALSGVGLVAHGWIYGYFWTSAVLIYLVLRRDVDGTPWHVIAPPEARPYEFAAKPAEATSPVSKAEGAEEPATPAHS